MNYSAEIWIFWEDGWEVEDLSNLIQEITIKFQRKGTNENICISAVYVRCSALERLELWNDLEWVVDQLQCPCLVG